MADKKWTEQQKVAFLVSVVENLGGTPDWKSLALPAGRTQKSCQHMLSKLKQFAKENYAESTGTDGSPAGSPITHKTKLQMAGASEDADDEITPTKTPGFSKAKVKAKRGKRGLKDEEKTAPKTPSNDGDNEEVEGGQVKSEKAEDIV